MIIQCNTTLCYTFSRANWQASYQLDLMLKLNKLKLFQAELKWEK